MASCRFILPLGKDNSSRLRYSLHGDNSWCTTLRRSSAFPRCLALELGIDPNLTSKLGVYHDILNLAPADTVKTQRTASRAPRPSLDIFIVGDMDFTRALELLSRRDSPGTFSLTFDLVRPDSTTWLNLVLCPESSTASTSITSLIDIL